MLTRTFFEKTIKLVEEAKTRGHFQKAIVKMGDYLILLAISLVIVIFIASIFRGQNALEIIQFALVLTVAAIPAALSAVMGADITYLQTLFTGAGGKQTNPHTRERKG